MVIPPKFISGKELFRERDPNHIMTLAELDSEREWILEMDFYCGGAVTKTLKCDTVQRCCDVEVK